MDTAYPADVHQIPTSWVNGGWNDGERKGVRKVESVGGRTDVASMVGAPKSLTRKKAKGPTHMGQPFCFSQKSEPTECSCRHYLV
jgi:hypothetical protein